MGLSTTYRCAHPNLIWDWNGTQKALDVPGTAGVTTLVGGRTTTFLFIIEPHDRKESSLPSLD